MSAFFSQISCFGKTSVLVANNSCRLSEKKIDSSPILKNKDRTIKASFAEEGDSFKRNRNGIVFFCFFFFYIYLFLLKRKAHLKISSYRNIFLECPQEITKALVIILWIARLLCSVPQSDHKILQGTHYSLLAHRRLWLSTTSYFVILIPLFVLPSLYVLFFFSF